jgi:hypothetical protein
MHTDSPFGFPVGTGEWFFGALGNADLPLWRAGKPSTWRGRNFAGSTVSTATREPVTAPRNPQIAGEDAPPAEPSVEGLDAVQWNLVNQFSKTIKLQQCSSPVKRLIFIGLGENRSDAQERAFLPRHRRPAGLACNGAERTRVFLCMRVRGMQREGDAGFFPRGSSYCLAE